MDLDAAGYAGRVDEADERALDQALGWLASFHARFLGEQREDLWPIGTYWHLETRRDELSRISDARLRAEAPRIAERLASARFQTIVHGDPKEANFCFGPAGVAAVDFQYTGRACGMVDVAYLLYGAVTSLPTASIGHASIGTSHACAPRCRRRWTPMRSRRSGASSIRSRDSTSGGSSRAGVPCSNQARPCAVPLITCS